MEKQKIYMNMCIPLILGGLLYCISSPDVIFVRWICKCIEGVVHISIDINEITAKNIISAEILRMIRNYVPDMLWAYSLIFALILVMGNKIADVWKAYIISIIFSTIIEVLQLTGIVIGTFDIKDIIVEIIAQTMAVFIIKHIEIETHSTVSGNL